MPAPSGFITDRAGVIEPTQEAEIIALLNEVERQTGAEVAVLTVQSTQPFDDLDYARSVLARWKIGKEGKGNGVLLLLAVHDRRVRILPGWGLEKLFPNDRLEEIVDNAIVPNFKQGQLGLGIHQGVWALAREIAADAGITLHSDRPEGAKRRSRGGAFRILHLLVLAAAGFLIVGWFLNLWHGSRKAAQKRWAKASRSMTDRVGGAFGRGSGFSRPLRRW